MANFVKAGYNYQLKKGDYLLDFIDPKKFIEKHIVSFLLDKKTITVTDAITNTAISMENNINIDFQQLHSEYNLFLNHQTNIIHAMKENTKYMEQLQLDYVETLLSSQQLPIKKKIHTCDLCHRGFRNLKALTTHSRSCLVKSDKDKQDEITENKNIAMEE